MIEKKYKGRMSLFYYAELTYQPTYCENCLAKNDNFSIVKMVRKPQRLLCLKLWKCRLFKSSKQRFYCKTCDSHFTAKSDIVDDYCFISNKTKLAVLNKAQECRSQNLSLSHA